MKNDVHYYPYKMQIVLVQDLKPHDYNSVVAYIFSKRCYLLTKMDRGFNNLWRSNKAHFHLY